MTKFNREEYWNTRSSYPTDELGMMADAIDLKAELDSDDAIRLREAMAEIDYFRRLHEVE